MKYLSRSLIILALLLLIAVACSYLYLRSGRIAEPLARFIQEQTGYELTIGDAEYNPLYPDTILLRRISAGEGFAADQIYVEFDSASLARGELLIRELEAVNVTLNTDLLPPIRLKPKGGFFRNVTIKDLHLKDFSLRSGEWSIDDSIIELSNLDLIREGRPNIPENFFVNMFANRLKKGYLILHSFNTSFHYTPDHITVDEFRTELRDGSVFSQLDIYPPMRQAVIRRLDVSRINAAADMESISELMDWQLDVYDASFSGCSADLPDLGLAVTGLTLSVNDLTWKDHQLQHISILGSAEGLTYGNLMLQNVELSLSQPLSNPVSHILLSGKYSGGTVETYAKYNKNTDVLDFHEFSARGLRLTSSDTDTLSEMADMINVREIGFRVINIEDLYYDALEDSSPVILREGSFFANHAVYRDGNLRSRGRKSHIEMSAGELAAADLDTRGIWVELELDDTGTVRLLSADARVNGGKVNASGMWDLEKENCALEVSGKDVGTGYVRLLFSSFSPVATSDFTLSVKGCGRREDTEFRGRFCLRDIMVSGMDPDLFSGTVRGPELKTRWVHSRSSGRNLMASQAELDISADADSYQISGTVDAFSRIYRLDSSFHPEPEENDFATVIREEKPALEDTPSPSH